MCKTEDGKIKISLKDMITSGSTGQTSATGAVGVLYELLTLLIVLSLVIFYFVNQEEAANIMAMIDKMTIIMGIGAALLGTRKISGAIANANEGRVVKAVEDAIDERERKYVEYMKNERYFQDQRQPYPPRNIYRTEATAGMEEELADETVEKGDQ